MLQGKKKIMIANAKKRRERAPLLELSEADIARTCSDLLQADGWRMFITDPVSNRERGKGFGELGMADRLYIRYGFPNDTYWGTALVMWIEWKRTRRGVATKATDYQKDWHTAERARGALTLIAGEDFPATIEGFAAWYKASGLQRRGSDDPRKVDGMSERDPITEPRPGDVWTWASDRKPCAIVGTRETKDGIWFNSPVDNLPLAHFLSMRDFFAWARTAQIVERGAE